MAKTTTAKKTASAATDTSANVGYQAQLWQMADVLRGSMDLVAATLDAAIAANLKEPGYGE